MKHDRKQQRRDVWFVRRAGMLMHRWEQQRTGEIAGHAFLLKPEVQERVERIVQCIRRAKTPPTSFRHAFDPVYNQISFTLEDWVLSSQCYPLHEMLGTADAYSLETLTDGRIVLTMEINDAAYEVEE